MTLSSRAFYNFVHKDFHLLTCSFQLKSLREVTYFSGGIQKLIPVKCKPLKISVTTKSVDLSFNPLTMTEDHLTPVLIRVVGCHVFCLDGWCRLCITRVSWLSRSISTLTDETSEGRVWPYCLIRLGLSVFDLWSGHWLMSYEGKFIELEQSGVKKLDIFWMGPQYNILSPFYALSDSTHSIWPLSIVPSINKEFKPL